MQSSSMSQKGNNSLPTKLEKNMLTLEKWAATIKSQLGSIQTDNDETREKVTSLQDKLEKLLSNKQYLTSYSVTARVLRYLIDN